MEFQLDRDVNALYVKLRPGNVSRTLGSTDTVHVDMAAQDTPSESNSSTPMSSSRSCANMPMATGFPRR
jgi:hypothetical protein